MKHQLVFPVHIMFVHSPVNGRTSNLVSPVLSECLAHKILGIQQGLVGQRIAEALGLGLAGPMENTAKLRAPAKGKKLWTICKAFRRKKIPNSKRLESQIEHPYRCQPRRGALPRLHDSSTILDGWSVNLSSQSCTDVYVCISFPNRAGSMQP
ncbi:uncharacterized protein K489DRAFT_248841 [Dissoconium aciculare CBS 342.82]|uniref:Uncharacterized protein n=1 Tax=Dissoconium aciculare CBS 342.82 TaxID=1314786 RepID=A0A6J3M0B9_9PEZI|nr:uncharacterized protein K489DRAFT_248841 [Dissoconium aciculare CBS 342.82]KAF1821480.1 hypothetical protein K489DRAFT_248841 [Dissoconium aciculare CBS 342.82]